MPVSVSNRRDTMKHNLAKVGVERSNRFTRSNFPLDMCR